MPTHLEHEVCKSVIDGLTLYWQSSPECEGVAETLRRLQDQDLSKAARQQRPATSKPVTGFLEQALQVAESQFPAVAAPLRTLSHSLRWLQSPSYTDEILGEGFSRNYAWCELIGTDGFFAGNDFILGFLLLGPNRHYLDHYHPAPELYWPMTAPSLWKKGDSDFVERRQGEVIWHPPMVIHATITKEAPLLAAYAWTRDTKTGARLCALDG